ncbi:sirohydrochlorin chelatase [Kitasatospora sp. NPDC052868]|uniref:sirohydrochlorin chelatase n=1 Tax=Kitasatospora sp. NPDC052868 TaxID=3364060 RepID=UPI0037C95834
MAADAVGLATRAVEGLAPAARSALRSGVRTSVHSGVRTAGAPRGALPCAVCAGHPVGHPTGHPVGHPVGAASTPGDRYAAGRRPVLLAVAHGSRDQQGVAATGALLARVRALRPELRVRCCFLDLAQPSLPQALAEPADAGEEVVLVPLLLGAGYHLRVDIPTALTEAGATARLAPALGPHPLLAAVLADRLAETGRPPGVGPVVLAAAGSSDPAAHADTRRMADLLARRLGDGRPVVPAFLSAAGPTPAEAVAALHAAGHRDVAVATHLLGPGFFARRAAGTAARWTSAPLGTHDALARLVALRYDEACRTAAVR